MRKRALLNKKKIEAALKKFPKWKLDKPGKKLTRTISFNKHVDGAVFIVRGTVHAEVLQHHPDITFTYKKVKVVTTTHDSNGLTKLDIDLIERLEGLLGGG